MTDENRWDTADFLILIPTAVAAGLWRAFVVWKAWCWLAVPLFGAPVVGYWPAVGVALALQVAKGFGMKDTPDPRRLFVHAVVVSAFYALTLGAIWLVAP